jgi:hypothetical protein
MNQMTLGSRLKELAETPQLIEIYAKGNCKHCLGRGFERLSHPVLGNSVRFCDCVKKNITKEIKEIKELEDEEDD